MDYKSIAASIRGCTVAETQALSLWSASFLPLCRMWAAKHGLRPPVEIIEMLQKKRFDIPSLPKMQFDSLLTRDTNNRSAGDYAAQDSKLAKIAADLSHDLQQMQSLTSQTGACCQQHFLTTARDLRRFQRAALYLQFTALEIVASEPIIVPLFSPQHTALYLPLWLINALPQTVFEPNQSLYRPRQASPVWLLFDAIVIANTGEFKTI